VKTSVWDPYTFFTDPGPDPGKQKTQFLKGLLKTFLTQLFC